MYFQNRQLLSLKDLIFKYTIKIVVGFFVFGILYSHVFAQMSSTNYQVPKDIINESGGSSQSTNYKILHNLGESVIGDMASSNYKLESGFIESTPPSIFFSISDNAVSFGKISASSRWATTTEGSDIEALGFTAIVSTNASNGFQLRINNAFNPINPGLYSATASYVISSLSQVDYNLLFKGYSVYGISSSGMDIASGFVKNTGTEALDNSSKIFAYSDEPIDGATVDIGLVAKTDALAPAGSYQDIITLICTGLF